MLSLVVPFSIRFHPTWPWNTRYLSQPTAFLDLEQRCMPLSALGRNLHRFASMASSLTKTRLYWVFCSHFLAATLIIVWNTILTSLQPHRWCQLSSTFGGALRQS